MTGRRTLIAVVAIGAILLVAWFLWLPAPHSESAPSAEGTALAEVMVPESLSEQAQIGKLGFEAKCASCHGMNAAGQNGIAPPLVHKIYEPGHHGDMAFMLAAQNGVRSHHWPFGDMPPVEGLTRSDVMNIVFYVRELQQANGIN